MSAIGTTRTFRNVRYLVAVGCKADMKCSVRAFPLLTHLGRGPINFAVLQNTVSLYARIRSVPRPEEKVHEAARVHRGARRRARIKGRRVYSAGATTAECRPALSKARRINPEAFASSRKAVT